MPKQYVALLVPKELKEKVKALCYKKKKTVEKLLMEALNIK